MQIKDKLRKLNWFFSSQFGIKPKRIIRSLSGVPRYLGDLKSFRREYSGKTNLMPCLHDWYEEGGATKSEYFWQDLLVARWINESNPNVHVDVGSRVDGFVAHVASFREIEVFDVRPITSKVPGIVFRQADIMQENAESRNYIGYCDSLSCLHALEHFGLGRYGDQLAIDGVERGIANMSSFILPGGKLYLSTPVGVPRVEFNAHRVSDPRTIVDVASQCDLELENLTIITNVGDVVHTKLSEVDLNSLARENYNLGVFVFRKLNLD